MMGKNLHCASEDTLSERESQLNENWEGKVEGLEKQVEQLIREKEELEDALASTEERRREAQDGQVTTMRKVVGSILSRVIFRLILNPPRTMRSICSLRPSLTKQGIH